MKKISFKYNEDNKEEVEEVGGGILLEKRERNNFQGK
jgi:hypothetical protein